MRLRLLWGSGLAYLVVVGVALSAQSPPALNFSCDGADSAARSCAQFSDVMKYKEVQQALLSIARQPRSLEAVEVALENTGVSPERLEALGLIRRRDGQYVIAFSLYTRADLDRLRQIAERHGANLAGAFLRRRSEIQSLLKRDPVPGVDWRLTAYFIVGCVSLDWDGLELTAERGYRTDGTYLPEAREPGGGGSPRGLYWGSRNWHDKIAFTSFGDHYSAPRHALPNLLGTIATSTKEPIGSHMVTASRVLLRHHTGTMMLALRDGSRDTAALAAATGLRESEARPVIEFLSQIGYVTSENGSYRAAIPVLSERDADMVRELRRLGREIMTGWFDANHQELTRELAQLTPFRAGVPIADGFYWVWHYVFGVANRELVAAGLFADPYDPQRVFKGYIPAVYSLQVVQGPP